VKYQHRQGHSCQVVCLYSSGSLAHELDEFGIAVKVCGKRQGFDLSALAQARRMVSDHATEVLHTHNAVAHYQAVLATCGLPVRRVINTRHGMGVNRRARRREWFYRGALVRTDTVVAVCEAARNDAIMRGIIPLSKARVVPNGISVEAFQTASSSTRGGVARLLGLPEQTRIIGTVGRLNWTKDQLGLIRAFKLVHQYDANTALVLIGDGELRASLQQSAMDEGVGDCVYFLGDRGDVRQLLQGLDMFVLSSLSEGYSMALLEASAVALPIVATNVGGNGEIVRNGVTGRLVPAQDPAALAEAMLALLRNPRHALALGQAARAWVERYGSLETMAMRYAQLYDGSKE
ncbi:MAG TPA: glycosyltransferase, partial [Dyella sp.]|nr:glycosyltransferase [Dyella sp.]